MTKTESDNTELPAEAESGPLATVAAMAPAGWRQKLARVALQLIAGTEKGAMMYSEARDRLDTIEGRSLVAQTLARAVADQAASDPEILERARSRFVGKALQQQANLEAVIVGSAEYLPRLPAFDGANEALQNNPPADFDAGEASEDKIGDPSAAHDQPLDQDWAATFTGLAENATSDELRNRLSKLLAGELASPGTYSRATVRAIAELERDHLEAMQAVQPYVFWAGDYSPF